MKVSVESIRKFTPCETRFDDNFLIHYPNYDDTLENFLSLDKITYDDKIWVARRMLNKNQLVHWALLCAQSVLQIYQNKYPNDNRVSDCINFMLTIADFSSLDNDTREKLIELRKNAYDAATDAAIAAATDAAYAAYAAAYAAAAYVADTDAADAAAAYAADAYVAYAAAAYAADADTDARKIQQDLNLQFLLIASKL